MTSPSPLPAALNKWQLSQAEVAACHLLRTAVDGVWPARPHFPSQAPLRGAGSQATMWPSEAGRSLRTSPVARFPGKTPLFLAPSLLGQISLRRMSSHTELCFLDSHAQRSCINKPCLGGRALSPINSPFISSKTHSDSLLWRISKPVNLRLHLFVLFTPCWVVATDGCA